MRCASTNDATFRLQSRAPLPRVGVREQIVIKEGDMVEDTSMFYIILSGTVKVFVITPTSSQGYGQEVATLSVGEVRTLTCGAPPSRSFIRRLY
jgi:CRP-like cAMP-binding protein